MCLILLSYNTHPQFRIILAANRDEFYDRPSAQLHSWEDHPNVLAGRDLKSMGTWMGITRSGKIAAITNYREPERIMPAAPSRGHLVSDFLLGHTSPAAYLSRIEKIAGRYNGFNLLVGDPHELVYYSNRKKQMVRLEAGVFGMSNRLLNSPWPKVEKGKSNLAQLIARHHDIPFKHILYLLKCQDVAPDHQLPDTGVGVERERMLSPIFITSPNYGTRCSTIVTIDRSNHVRMVEYTWQPGQPEPILQDIRSFTFTLKNNAENE